MSRRTSQIHQAESLRDHDALLNDAEIQGRIMHVVLVLVVVGNMLPAAIFFGLYMWAKNSPLPAIVAGLVTHVTFTIATVAFNPQVALAPMFWVIRIAILTALAKAIQSAMHEKKMREKERKREEARRRAGKTADEAGAGAEAALSNPDPQQAPQPEPDEAQPAAAAPAPAPPAATKVIRCPNCYHRFRSDKKFCPKCGA